jgi:hypothetical protein
LADRRGGTLELCAALIIAGRRIRKLLFGRRDGEERLWPRAAQHAASGNGQEERPRAGGGGIFSVRGGQTDLNVGSARNPA